MTPFRTLIPLVGWISSRTMAANAAIVAGAFAVSRVLGLVREIVIAAHFGTGDTYDAYLAAFRIPDLIFVVVMSGAFGSAFIPVFGGFLARNDPDRAWKLANALLTWTLVILASVAQVVLLFAGPLINDVIAPELPPDAQRLAVNLTRLLLLSPLLLGLGAAAKGMLEAHDAFLLPAVAPILYNLGIILGAVALTPLIGIYGLAAGVILGAAGHVAIQFAALLKYGFRVRPSLSRDIEGLADVARLMLPRIAGQVAGHANLIVMTNFASRLGEGRISALSYAQHLVMLPHGIIAMSLSTVIFPRMARQFERGEIDNLTGTLRRALGPLLLLTIPAAIGLFAFRVSIVQVVLQYGSFSRESTALVADAVGYFALGLLARALIEPITRAFYAMRDTRTPLVVALLAIIVNIALSWSLAPRLGHGGLALSISITSILRMLTLMIIFARRTGRQGEGLFASLPRLLPAAATMAVVAIGVESFLRPITDPANGRTVWSYSLFFFSLAGTGMVFVSVAYLFRSPELIRVAQTLRRRRYASGAGPGDRNR